MSKFVACEAAECDSVTTWGSEDWILSWIEVERQEVKVDLCSWACLADYAEEMATQ